MVPPEPSIAQPLPMGEACAPPAAAPPPFRAIFDAQAAYVWHTLRRLGVHDRDIEDVAHEVFLTVHRRLADYDPARPLRPWIFGIALRTAMRYRELARHRREVIDSDVEATDGEPPVDEQMVERLDAEAARALVGEALDSLDLDRRAVFVLHELDGVGVPGIAESLGIPLNTAYSRLRRAREQFRGAVRRIQLRRGTP